MTLILLLIGTVGFLSSFLLLHCGISRMWFRYPLAITAAYAAFLLLLRFWLALHHWQNSSGSDVSVDLGIDVPVDFGSGGAVSPNADFYGGGGDFGGGGAGGSWGDAVSPTPASFSDSDVGGSSFLDGVSIDLDLEELGLLILAVVALLGGLIASLYVVYIAPALLAEILVDGVLLGGLYKQVKHIERKHWLRTAVRKTLVPAILCIIFFGVVGGALQMAVPEAKSIGEVWKVLISDTK